ncbi:hypothetical protein N4T77_06690 [Clostridium sp. CX1]|uniref:hypothetical protein n=1 Tax=Clostridium sp. CX1 TaxID=2978346 RepID=UPI0021BEBF5E|nr:hypothetical protein [Clostridium sp. CX1]MCT8976280.1 hypothetical protein [Clostridium sp. CX1]
MKHYTGEIISVYDGELIGWTTATLIEFVGKIGGYERWRMITKEGSELRRLVDFDKKYINQPKTTDFKLLKK